MNRRSLIQATAATALLAGLQGVAHAQSLTQDAAPEQSGRFTNAIGYSAERAGVGFLAMRHGVLLAEDYPNGGHFQGTLSLGLLSKAFAPLIVASLVRDRLATLDEPAFFTLAEWGADPTRQRITLRHLLQQTSGIQPTPVDQTASPLLAEALARPLAAEPGNVYAEDAAGFQLLAEIARRRLSAAGAPSDLALYLQARALEDVGVAPLGWRRLADGQIDLAGGASSTLRAIARLAEFVRRRGLWRAEFQVSPQTIDAAVVGTLASRGRVGMGWRRADAEPLAQGETDPMASDLWGLSDIPRDTLMARDIDGLRVFLIPSRALVLARAGAGGGWSDAAFLRLALNES
jgi:CubicO group peptidase (beta-lactamase class C family)